MPRESFVSPAPTLPTIPNAVGYIGGAISPLSQSTGSLLGYIFRCNTPTGATVTHWLVSATTDMLVKLNAQPSAPLAGLSQQIAVWLDKGKAGSPASDLATKSFSAIEGGAGHFFTVRAGETVRIDWPVRCLTGTHLSLVPVAAMGSMIASVFWNE